MGSVLVLFRVVGVPTVSFSYTVKQEQSKGKEDECQVLFVLLSLVHLLLSPSSYLLPCTVEQRDDDETLDATSLHYFS